MIRYVLVWVGILVFCAVVWGAFIWALVSLA